VIVAQRVDCPEFEFLRAVFGGQLPERALGTAFAPEGEMALRELRHEIDSALDLLSYRDRGVIEMRYGLGDGYAYTLAETGFVFQLTRERVRQIQARALEKLRRGAGPLRDLVQSLGAGQA
jgi:RNA polymerase primary sigma factor